MNISSLQQLLRTRTGMAVSGQALRSALRRRVQERGGGDVRACEQEALRDESELQALIELLVVPESWFFREREAFDAAVRIALEKTAGGARIRALCLPCAGGEEPYTLAIALHDAGIGRAACDIDAMDISTQAIARARAATYQRNAFRSHDLSFRDRHFSSTADGYVLHGAIRGMVRFAEGNLLNLAPPDPLLRYDLVFCRNLLIYFDAATQAKAAARLRALLHDDGVLFAGYAETMSLSQNGFRLLPVPRAFAMRKSRGSMPRALAFQAPPLPPRPKTHRMPHATVPAPPPVPGPAPSGAGDAADASSDLLAQARSLADRGETAQAVAACSSYLERMPDAAEGWFLLGLLHDHQRDDTAASHCFGRAVYLDPSHYEALCHLALLAERNGDQAQAQRCRRRAARVHERSDTTRMNR